MEICESWLSDDVPGTKGMWKASKTRKTETGYCSRSRILTGIEELAARAVVTDGAENNERMAKTVRAAEGFGSREPLR